MYKEVQKEQKIAKTHLMKKNKLRKFPYQIIKTFHKAIVIKIWVNAVQG